MDTNIEQKEGQPALNVYTAVIAVMGQVGYVQKKMSPGLRYSFAGEAALIKAIRPAMVAEGLFCYVEELTEVENREYLSTNGTQMVNVTMTGYVRFVHAPSGTSFRVSARGEGSDSGDKANNKAMTGLLKYGLRQTFLIETGDDPDDDDQTDRASASHKPAANPRPANNGASKSQGQPAPAEQKPERDVNVRPFPPEVLKKKYSEAVGVITTKGQRLGPNDGPLVEMCLNAMMEDYGPYLNFLTGKTYYSDLSEEEIVALFRLFKPSADKDSGEIKPDAVAGKEAAEVLALVKIAK